MKLKLFFIVFILVITITNAFSQTGRVYIKAEVIQVYTSVNDDNGTDEYRWNIGLNWGGMQCISASGGPRWYPAYVLLMNQTTTTPPANFIFNVDFFEDAACGGWDCTFKGSCGLKKNDAERCNGNHGPFDFKAFEPGKNHEQPILGICGKWGLQLRFYYTPPRPSPITISGTTNLCGGSPFTLYSGGAVHNGKYLWQEEVGGVWVSIINQNGPSLTQIAPANAPLGSYLTKKYRVFTQNNGVLSLDAQEKTLFVYPPAALSIEKFITNATCYGGNNGSIVVDSINGGYGPFSIAFRNISTGMTYGIPRKVNSANFNGLTAGIYLLVVTNNDGVCAYSTTVAITQPPKLSISNVLTSKYNDYNLRCNGSKDGSVQILASGGVSPYSYILTKGTFSEVNDEGMFNNLVAGDYTITITDQNNCSVSKTMTLTEPPSVFATTVIPTDIECSGNNDGQIYFSASGGIRDYEYSIDNGAGFSSNSVFQNLLPGTYICITKDANLCEVSDTIVLVEPNKLIIVLDSIRHVSCFNGDDGYIAAAGSGGTGTYKYSLNNVLIQNNNHAIPNLSAGYYNIKVRDGNNCLDSISIAITEPKELDINFIVEQVQCTGFNNGKVKAAITGGVFPYTYIWNGFSDVDSTLENLAPGSYTLTVMDSHNCQKIESVLVSEPKDGLVANITKKKDAKCNIVCNGEVEVSASGGTSPYSYLWNDINLTNTSYIGNLCKGSYEVKIVDSRNCVASSNLVIEDSVRFSISLPDSAKLCPGQSISLNAGNPGCNYEWNLSGVIQSTNQNYTLNGDGNYQLKVIKPDGCYAVHTVNVKTTTDLLNANFILPSFVALGDTVVFVEISQPLPDSTSWSFEGSPVIVDPTKDSPVLYFENGGTYLIKLTAYLGQCIDSLSKNITFFIPPDDSSSIDSLALGVNRIRDIKLFPNPNDGNFKIEITLDKPDSVNLGIYNSQGTSIDNYIGLGKNNYLIDYNLPLGNGIYILKVQSTHDYKTITFIVN